MAMEPANTSPFAAVFDKELFAQENDCYSVQLRARMRDARKTWLLCAVGHCAMTMRSRREKIHFRHPFRIKGIDRLLPPGDEIVTDEEMIEAISFPCFRRVATLIMIPGVAAHHSSMEMISISSVDLSDAPRIDASAPRE